MSDANHGSPCWYELSTTDPTAAGAFYAPVLGWTMIVQARDPQGAAFAVSAPT